MPLEAVVVDDSSDLSVDATDGATRVLFVVDSYLPGVGGAEIQAVNLGAALSAKGVHVEFVAPRLYREWPKNHLIEGMRVTKIDYPRIRLLGSFILILKFAFFLLRHGRKYDSIHIHVTDKLASTAGLLRPLIKAKMIAKISGYYEFEEGVLKTGDRFNPIQMFNRAGLHNIDYFQTISQQTREKLLEAGFKQQQIKYIPNGIAVDLQYKDRPLAERANFVVGYCGRLRDIKGVDVLIRALGIVLQQPRFAHVQLRIAGGGRTRPKLEALVDELGIRDSVEFLGSIQETQTFMETLDLYVQPSHAEGLPNSVIEAMNAGCPIVATDIGGNRDLVHADQNGYLVEAGDYRGMAKAIERCIEQGGSLSTFGQSSHKIIADDFSFESVTDQLMDLYTS